nr:5-hydroxytryptamine receptor 3B [Macaca nemestrina]
MLASVMAPLWACILVAAGILATDTHHPRDSALYHLSKQLLQNYHKEVRPVYNWTKATTVYLDLFVHAILDVDAENQILKTSVWYREVWNDEFLSWNSSLFDEIREISLPLSAIWAPDIIINEFMDVERSLDLPYVYVNSSGTIENSKPIQVVSACSLETYAFPFDVQNCSLTFKSILHTVEDVDLAFLRSPEDIKRDKKVFLNDSEWELLSVSSTYSILQSSAGGFAQIQFNVVMRRHPLVYVVSLLIPSIFLMLVDLGSFYMPPNCQARIVFKTSVLVGYTVFRVNMSNQVPRSVGSTPLIGKQPWGHWTLILPDPCERSDAGQAWWLTPVGVFLHHAESSFYGEHLAQPGTLKEIWSQLQCISNYLQTQDQTDQQEAEWLVLLSRFDRLLFRSYLFMLGLYTITLCSLWALWGGVKCSDLNNCAGI